MTLAHKIFAEAFGTFILIFTISCSEGDPYCVGGVVWVTMVFTRFVSGAIFNPAITLSIAVKKMIEKTFTFYEFKLFLVYTVVQYIGGFAGALLAWALTDFAFFYDFANDYPSYKAGICEAIFTCILCINAHMVGKSSKGLYMETFIVVLTFVTGAKSIGHLSKNCLNPCIAVTMNLVYYIIHGTNINHVWIYVVGPMVGGVIASFISLFYRDLRLRNEDDMYRSSLFFSPKSTHELKSVYQE